MQISETEDTVVILYNGSTYTLPKAKGTPAPGPVPTKIPIEYVAEYNINIRIGKKQGDKLPIEYIGEGKDNYNDSIMHIPFLFDYSAWNRQKKLIDDGNLKAIECHREGASAEPRRYINNAAINVDSYNDKKPLYPPVGEWLLSENKLRFFFLTSVDMGGWYITVKTEYAGK